MRSLCLMALVLFVTGGPARVCPAQERTATCASCHAHEADQMGRSVHAALGCQECHNGNASYTLSSDDVRKYRVTPGTESAGSHPERPAFDHGASYAGKPPRKTIPVLCGSCHADVERMNPYGLPTDQLARYWTSGHGKTLRGSGDDRVAVCTDCHGIHNILPGRDPHSGTYPLNVPGTCATCHSNATLMDDFDLPVEVVEEYRQSVHGQLLLESGDTGSPTCATCHDNHSAMPSGFATVGAVCGQCHQHAELNFSKSIHADQPEFRGCVQCHGGGVDRHSHLIERITQPAGIMIQRYAHLLASKPAPSAAQITGAINADPRKIMEQVLPSCTECHEDIEDDESLPKLFELLDKISEAELRYVQTARRLDSMAQGVLLVDAPRFRFEDAKTHLIELAPLQHALDNSVVEEKVEELNLVCAQVHAELDKLENGLRWRRRALIPIWLFALLFATACYAKYKQLKAVHVEPFPEESKGR